MHDRKETFSSRSDKKKGVRQEKTLIISYVSHLWGIYLTETSMITERVEKLRINARGNLQTVVPIPADISAK